MARPKLYVIDLGTYEPSDWLNVGSADVRKRTVR